MTKRSRAHAVRRVVIVGVAISLVVLYLAFCLVPVRVSPTGAGSVRCARVWAPYEGEGLGPLCRDAARRRIIRTSVIVGGVLIITLGRAVWLNRRRTDDPGSSNSSDE